MSLLPPCPWAVLGPIRPVFDPVARHGLLEELRHFGATPTTLEDDRIQVIRPLIEAVTWIRQLAAGGLGGEHEFDRTFESTLEWEIARGEGAGFEHGDQPRSLEHFVFYVAAWVFTSTQRWDQPKFEMAVTLRPVPPLLLLDRAQLRHLLGYCQQPSEKFDIFRRYVLVKVDTFCRTRDPGPPADGSDHPPLRSQSGRDEPMSMSRASHANAPGASGHMPVGPGRPNETHPSLMHGRPAPSHPPSGTEPASVSIKSQRLSHPHA